VDVKTRLIWIRMYETVGDFGVVCRRCGVSRPTLRKWWNRYKSEGIEGLHNRSRARILPQTGKVTEKIKSLILEMRSKRNLGAKRIRAELIR